MALSMIASRKAAPLAALIRKLALNDARALQAAPVQATRSFSTNAMREVDSSDDGSNLDRRSDRRDAWKRGWKIRHDDFPSGVEDPSYSLYWDEDENRLELQADMPGLGNEHVKVRVVQNMLIIKGEGEEEEGYKDGARRYASRIEFTDMDRYKMDEMEAEMKNGILKIVVPKVKGEEKDAFQINVK